MFLCQAKRGLIPSVPICDFDCRSNLKTLRPTSALLSIHVRALHKPFWCFAAPQNNSVRVGSLRHSDTGSGNGRCNSPLFPSTGSWGQALPGSSWQDPQCPQPSISADEEKEDTRKGYHNQEGGRGFGPPLSQDSRLQAIGVLGRNAGFAPASDHFLQEARDQVNTRREVNYMYTTVAVLQLPFNGHYWPCVTIVKRCVYITLLASRVRCTSHIMY